MPCCCNCSAFAFARGCASSYVQPQYMHQPLGETARRHTDNLGTCICLKGRLRVITYACMYSLCTCRSLIKPAVGPGGLADEGSKLRWKRYVAEHANWRLSLLLASAPVGAPPPSILQQSCDRLYAEYPAAIAAGDSVCCLTSKSCIPTVVRLGRIRC
jgi:hypothetical protein